MEYSYKIIKKEEVCEILLTKLPHRPGIAASIFSVFAKEDINIILIHHNYTGQEGGDASIFISRDNSQKAYEIIMKEKENLGVTAIDKNDTLVFLSISSVHFKKAQMLGLEIFKALCNENITLHILSIAGENVNIVIPEDSFDRALNSLERYLGDPIISTV